MEERADLYTPLKADERLPEHSRFAAAGIPKDAWFAKRDNILITPDNAPLVQHITQFIDRRLAILGNGVGISVVGPSKCGKSFLLCQVLRSMIVQERNLQIGEDHSDCQRVDYTELCSLYKSDLSSSLIATLRDARLLFVDNIYNFWPQAALLSCLEARRDNRRTTLLSFLTENKQIDQSVWRVYTIYQDVNTTFTLDRCVLEDLRGRR